MSVTTASEVGAVGAVAPPPSVRMMALKPPRFVVAVVPGTDDHQCDGAGLRGLRRIRGWGPEARPPYFGKSGRPLVCAHLRMDFTYVCPCVFVVFHDSRFVFLVVVFLHKLRYFIVDSRQL